MSSIDTIIALLEAGITHAELRQRGFRQLDIDVAESIIDDEVAWDVELDYDYD